MYFVIYKIFFFYKKSLSIEIIERNTHSKSKRRREKQRERESVGKLILNISMYFETFFDMKKIIDIIEKYTYFRGLNMLLS